MVTLILKGLFIRQSSYLISDSSKGYKVIVTIWKKNRYTHADAQIIIDTKNTINSAKFHQRDIKSLADTNNI